MTNKNYIYGYTEQNPYIVNNYPYGYTLRTQARYYIESIPKRGDRMVFQTLNPKTNKWNAPKKGTYSAIIVLWLDDNNHVKSEHLHAGWSDDKQVEDFAKHSEHLNIEQAKQYKYVKAIKATQKHISCEIINTTAWTTEQHAENDAKQEQTKAQIHRVFVHELSKA